MQSCGSALLQCQDQLEANEPYFDPRAAAHQLGTGRGELAAVETSLSAGVARSALCGHRRESRQDIPPSQELREFVLRYTGTAVIGSEAGATCPGIVRF